MKVEQDQKLTEDARISAEQDAAAQRYAVHVLQVLWSSSYFVSSKIFYIKIKLPSGDTEYLILV